MNTGSTVAAADIARLAGVGRAAVSNWRRRFPDFPEPVGGTASSPLYRLADVERWLSTHGRRIDVDPLDRAWQALRGAVDDHELDQAVAELGGLLLIADHHRAQWDRLAQLPDDEFLAEARETLQQIHPALPAAPGSVGHAGILRATAQEMLTAGAATAFTFLVEHLVEVRARRVPALPPAVAGMLVELADVRDRAVLDPACGVGAVLTVAAAAGAAETWGQDLDPVAARLCAIRLLLQGTSGGVVAGDSLRADALAGRTFGAVVCDPPYADRSWGYEELASDPRWEYGLPPKGESELAWAQHCLAHVEPGGCVVLLVPPTTAARRAGRRIRANLLRAGALRAVIALPPVHAAAPLDVWILRRPGSVQQAPGRVLIAVAERLDEVPQLWRRFDAAPSSEGERFRSVPVLDLLDEEVDLSPNRYVTTQAPAPDLPVLREEVIAALHRLADMVPVLDVAGGSPADGQDAPATTIGDLAKAGVVSVLQAPLRTGEEGESLALTARDLTARRGPTGRASDGPGTVRLQPRDVVVPALGGKELPVRVITADGPEVGALLGPRLLCFRLDPARLDPEFLAGHLRAAAGSVTARTATGLSRSDARRVPLPLLPLTEQQSRGRAFAQLAALEDGLRRNLDRGIDLVRGGTAGLADGSLRPREA